MIYTIYGLPNADFQTPDVDQLDGLKAVSEGLASWALIAPPIWLIIHRLWWPLFLCFLYWSFCLSLLATPFAAATPLIFGLPGLYLMLEGRELYRRNLEAQGLELVGLVEAASEQTAIARFLDGQQPAGQSRTTAATQRQTGVSPQLSNGSGQAEPVFGLFSSRGS